MHFYLELPFAYKRFLAKLYLSIFKAFCFDRISLKKFMKIFFIKYSIEIPDYPQWLHNSKTVNQHYQAIILNQGMND
ncbi:hypothetical protein EUQ19_16295 [Salmonella enterica subsp. enterica serovar Saintpaul]|nr:hypothetical protein [Salmonella enterica]EBV4847650.1 hypothetical protein [Salmonella enterica subsp. enterica serovar Typhimurium]EBY0328625.1 hypothetical protein [Salmonella enterica subsp. enterica serovar Agona]ECA9828271.1 hypothetical protein [Salmonella enterica subsp. enterica serovar Saintpaul]ECE8193332.1 hypothetical protein [Salmonella enterica subsp. enterica serovar Kottbus]